METVNTTAQTVPTKKITLNQWLRGDKRGIDKSRVRQKNIKLVKKGRDALMRMSHDNENVLYNKVALAKHRDHVPRKDIAGKPGRTKIDGKTMPSSMLKILEEDFVKMRDKRKNEYHIGILASYNDLESISPRSIYRALKWSDNTGLYGRNNGKGFEKVIKELGLETVYEMLDKIFGTYFELEMSEDSIVDNPNWTTKVKTDSNEGYARDGGYQKQTKQGVFDIRWASMKIVLMWEKDPKEVDWMKLLFAPSFRTERKEKARTISQGPKLEKPIAAMISWITDLRAKYLGIELPRNKGEMANLCKALLGAKTGTKFDFLAKDFSAFDANLPVFLFQLVLDYLRSRYYDEEAKKWENVFVKLFAFEVDLVIHAYLIVGNDLIYKMNSLPSGVGITQILGSILHALIDMLANLVFKLVYYQSDDTSGVPNMTESEIRKSMEFIENDLKMPISPLGDKSYLGDFTIILQVFIDAMNGVYYGHELRRWVNLFFRERQQKNEVIAVAEALRMNLKKESHQREVRRIVSALSYLGTLGSTG